MSSEIYEKSIKQIHDNATSLSEKENQLELDDSIKMKRTSIYINNKCYLSFETYRKKAEDTLILEKYNQYHSVSNTQNNNDLTRGLEIIYQNNLPIFTKYSDEHKKMEKFAVDSSVDAEIIVEKINNEVSIITSTIDEILNKQESVKKY